MTQATYVPNVTHTKAQALAFFQGMCAAAASNNSGAVAPAETWPGMLWVDTTAKALKMRNDANSAWITLGSYATGGFTPAGVAQLTAAQAGDPLSTVFGMVSGQVLSESVGGDIERLAEGATGAPKIMPRAMDQSNYLGRFIGTGNPVTANLTLDLGGLAGARVVRFDIASGNGAGSGGFAFGMSNASGQTTGYLNPVTSGFFPVPADTVQGTATFYMDFVSGEWFCASNLGGGYGTISPIYLPPQNITFRGGGGTSAYLYVAAHAITGRT
ncbi:hypothetical protein BV509_02435 [Rhodovulum sulfidophilum]|uniref:Tail fiber protein n=1 Tax=Rhodovulum visakhapatnamense TaxID=364297 RepID=A0ABS1RDI5_9RHOB|nr:hypothetical protein [Rhodovulum visakhapatnamense]MBL3570661.1 hypothetical protein [Rhodovulum visakhapatnamense]MBL3577698.1 hypothetical protein [Rhodovulum visakhapatnamense]OLS43306.1 hypothetical protein BV509_02435 [Rhodovulum sulfidophilum]